MKPAEAARAIASDLSAAGTPVADEIARAFGMYADALDLPDVPGVASADDGATTITLRVPAELNRMMAVGFLGDLANYIRTYRAVTTSDEVKTEYDVTVAFFKDLAQTLRKTARGK